MGALIQSHTRATQRVPVKLTVLGDLEGGRIELHSENISLDGMFLSSKDFVRPSAGFFARIWLPADDAPLQVYLTSCFIEQTWSGYGIGVHISGISRADRARWEAFYRSCVTTSAAPLRTPIQSERALKNWRMIVVDGALNPLAMQALRRQGLAVYEVISPDQAIERAQKEPVDVIVCNFRRPGMDGLALCCGIKSRRIPTRTVLLTESVTPKEFLLGIFAGATRVIAKSFSNDMLVTRILEILQQPLPGARVAPAARQKENPLAPVAGIPFSDQTAWDVLPDTIDNNCAA